MRGNATFQSWNPISRALSLYCLYLADQLESRNKIQNIAYYLQLFNRRSSQTPMQMLLRGLS